MKGSIRFDNEINVEVEVDPSQAEGARLLSAVNLVDGQELGSGGGGGGDFSYANVEIVFGTVPTAIGLKMFWVIYPNGIEASSADIAVPASAPNVDILMYQNSALAIIRAVFKEDGTPFDDLVFTTQGNITYDDAVQEFTITGDGTITISTVQ